MPLTQPGFASLTTIALFKLIVIRWEIVYFLAMNRFIIAFQIQTRESIRVCIACSEILWFTTAEVWFGMITC